MDLNQDDFPWHLGIYDAHCHPTDTMSSIPAIATMRARALTIMATRAQDQDLVDQTARKYGIKGFDEGATVDTGHVLPSFGWHPWFSHQLFDDALYNGKESLHAAEKITHYQSVLTPKRAELTEQDKQFFSALPDPQPLSMFLARTRQYLQAHPLALVGEVGLDRSFRIPQTWAPDKSERRDDSLTPGGREGRKLSPYHVDLRHQKKILLSQLRLAAEMRRAVSLHGVQVHGLLFETLKETWKGYERKVLTRKEKKQKDFGASEQQGNTDDSEPDDKPYPPRICLHSYSGNHSTFKQWLHPSIPVEVFASFSVVINLSDDQSATENFKTLIQLVPDDRLLVESDRHIAGAAMDTDLENIIRVVCKIKGWDLHEGVQKLSENWKAFAFGVSQ